MALHAQAARLSGLQAARTRSQQSAPRAQQPLRRPPLPRRRCRLPSTAAAEQPQLSRRRLLSIVPLPLLFLPWSGCDQGGNYATGMICSDVWRGRASLGPGSRDTRGHRQCSPLLAGIKGTPGKDCQAIYQPAAAAEKRCGWTALF